MKYTPDEALSEILRRSEQIALRRKSRSCQRLTGICSAFLAVLVPGVAVMPGKLTVTSASSVYGSFLLSREAGGYVLAALVAFVLGITVRYCRKETPTGVKQVNITILKEPAAQTQKPTVKDLKSKLSAFCCPG